MRRVCCAIAMVFVSGSVSPASAQLQSKNNLLNRTWTSSEGVEIDGEVTVFEGETVNLKTSKGFFRITMDKLDQADQDFIRRNAPPEIIIVPEKSTSKNGIQLRIDSRKSYKGSYKVTVGGSTVRNNATLRQVYTNIYLVVPFGFDISRLRLMTDAGKEIETKIPEFPEKELGSFLTVLKKNEPIIRELKDDAVTPQQNEALKEMVTYIEAQRDIGRELKWDPAVERESKYADELGENINMFAYYAEDVTEGELRDIRNVKRELSEIMEVFPDAMQQGGLWQVEILDHKYVGSDSVYGSIVLFEDEIPVQKIKLNIKGSNERFEK